MKLTHADAPAGTAVSFETAAPPGTAMQHIAVQEAPDGRAVGWMEQVSDEQYRQCRGESAAR